MDINSLIYSECHEPVKISVYNGIKNCYEDKYVPCGKCYHCKITRINEWVTRMVAQSNYSKYVYYGTLTYNGKRPTILNNECLSIISKFNKNNTPNDTPLILRKDHLQKFFKRLRKNTGVKFQYAACGEYGSTYSRPHFHYIIWSNDPISTLSVYKAWSAPRADNIETKCVIGKVEHRDIKNDPDPKYKDPDGTWCYKYVCKYIQKFDFDFEKLTNIKQHKKNYAKEFNYISTTTNEDFYLSSRLDDYLKEKKVKDWNDYQKVFSPFFTCSKKPSIGYQYLQDNIGEFQKCNFKLFGLPKEYIFPLYFIRKTKESLCPLKAQSETNDSITSYSRLPKMAALISNIQAAQSIAEESDQIVQLFTCNNNVYTLESRDTIQDLQQFRDERDKQPISTNYYSFKREYLGFVNTETGVFYSFRYNNNVQLGEKIQDNAPYFAMYRTRDNTFIGSETLENVKQLIIYYYEQLKKNILLSLMAKSEISSNKKEALIEDYGGLEKFNQAKTTCLKQLMDNIDKKQKLYKKSKTFE